MQERATKKTSAKGAEWIAFPDLSGSLRGAAVSAGESRSRWESLKTHLEKKKMGQSKKESKELLLHVAFADLAMPLPGIGGQISAQMKYNPSSLLCVSDLSNTCMPCAVATSMLGLKEKLLLQGGDVKGVNPQGCQKFKAKLLLLTQEAEEKLAAAWQRAQCRGEMMSLCVDMRP
jgi:hypothetical protein